MLANNTVIYVTDIDTNTPALKRIEIPVNFVDGKCLINLENFIHEPVKKFDLNNRGFYNFSYNSKNKNLLISLNTTSDIKEDVLQFNGLEKGSEFIKGYSYNFSDTKDTIDVTSFTDTFKREIIGERTIEFTVESYWENNKLKEYFKNGTNVIVQIWENLEDEEHETYIGQITGINRSGEVGQANKNTYKFKCRELSW